MGFLLRLCISALSLGLAAKLIPGIYVRDWFTLFLAAFLLGLVNAVVKPILVLMTLPITLVTLGLFLLIVNAAMLGLVAWLLPGFALAGFFPALFGWLVMALVGSLLSRLV
jgi:putative membrane protein